jgi:hypothetical protein
MEATMRASSDSIAQLAAAMAKAQPELVNPAKSLTAVLERGRNGNSPLSYRYAPLSAGLDILRKVLGKYELAVIQTTHMDRDRGLVVLTTTVAHSSGEWISAFWPVCHISDIGHPKLMGAALTYARRYCLFTMVGLAGEDDLDAPDLGISKESAREGASMPIAMKAAAVELETEPNVDLTRFVTDRSPDEPILEEHPLPSAEPTQADHASGPPGKRKYTRRARSPSALHLRASDPARGLAKIEDTDALFRWALNALPVRNKLDETRRAEFDAAFLARADAIGADPDMLIAFKSNDVPAELDTAPAPSAN